MIKLCGLWKHVPDEGKTFLAGTLGNARLVIFPNGFKTDQNNEPDFIVYIDEKKAREVPVTDPNKDPF